MISQPIINTNSQRVLYVCSCHRGLLLSGGCFLCSYSNQQSKAISCFRAPLFCFPFYSRDPVCPARYILKQHARCQANCEAGHFTTPSVMLIRTELIHTFTIKVKLQTTTVDYKYHHIYIYIYSQTAHQTTSLR